MEIHKLPEATKTAVLSFGPLDADLTLNGHKTWHYLNYRCPKIFYRRRILVHARQGKVTPGMVSDYREHIARQGLWGTGIKDVRPALRRLDEIADDITKLKTGAVCGSVFIGTPAPSNAINNLRLGEAWKNEPETKVSAWAYPITSPVKCDVDYPMPSVTGFQEVRASVFRHIYEQTARH